MDCWSWCSLLASGNTLDFNFYIFSFFSSLYSKSNAGNTLQAFFRVLCWSFAVLFSGVWPSKNHRGETYPEGSPERQRANTPLANGFFCVLVGVKGDLDYYAKVLRLPWYTSLKPCALCDCDSAETSWADFRPQAAWRNKVWTRVSWAAAFPDGHLLLRSAFSLGINSVCCDLMHTKHMGTDAWFYGSVLHLLVYSMMPLAPVANLETAWAAMRSFQQDRGSLLKTYRQNVRKNVR